MRRLAEVRQTEVAKHALNGPGRRPNVMHPGQPDLRAHGAVPVLGPSLANERDDAIVEPGVDGLGGYRGTNPSGPL